MIVGAHLDPIVDAAQHDVGGKDVGHRAVVELDVHHGKVVDVVVVAADVTFVAKGRQTRNGVGPGGNRLRPDRFAATAAAFDPLQIQRGRQRMAALADQHAPAAAGRIGVIHRVRSAVGLFAMNPENLPAGLFQDFPLLLDRRGVDPVFGIQEPALALSFGGEHPAHALHRRPQRRLFIGPVPMEILRAIAEVARQRLFADDELYRD